jgi:hypothetical protein
MTIRSKPTYRTTRQKVVPLMAPTKVYVPHPVSTYGTACGPRVKGLNVARSVRWQ